jgi:hypothetical protein
VHVAILHTGTAILRMIDRATPHRAAGAGRGLKELLRDKDDLGWSAYCSNSRTFH